MYDNSGSKPKLLDCGPMTTRPKRLKKAEGFAAGVGRGLLDGRNLLVVAGFSELPQEQRESMAKMKLDAGQMIEASGNHYDSPRLLAFASEGKGTRTLVDIAV
jgi:hypothetical protein